jgi:hypothetical protein
VVSPNGRSVVASGEDGTPRIYAFDGGPPAELPGAAPGDRATQWSSDGRLVYLCHPSGIGIDVFQVDLTTGRRELWKHVAVADAAGIVTVPSVIPTRDGRAYAYSYVRVLSTLFEVKGLR